MIDKILENLIWLGHDGFLLKAGGINIYFDPFQLKGDLPKADLLLITHDHFDHCSPEDIAKIVTPETEIITEPQSAEKLSGRVRTMAPGESCEINNIKIEAVASYNTNKKFHPQANKWLGFIITVDGVRIYHAGDTDYIPEMKDIKADIALLPVSGTYVMTADEAVQAALAINPQVAIPMHFGAIVGELSDAENFAKALENKIRVDIPVR
jgi:L-ascorbate metabolism protein UlaG (beta-lactamase superfamily)